MKTIKDIQHFEGVRMLVRADFNVPIHNDTVTDGFRIRMALPTIDLLRKSGAKVILISHMEAIGGDNPSLGPVAKKLSELGCDVFFKEKLRGLHEYIENEMKNGECVLLENIRLFDGEKNNDQKFARELASLADLYINEAFPVSHREHASIVSVPKYIPSYAGLQLEKEVTNLSKAFDPDHPFLFILGGAKFETKLPLMAKFLDSADKVFVGGALANDFFKAKGFEIGQSTISKSDFDFEQYLNNEKIIIPVDIVTEKNEVKDANLLGENERIMDSGPKSIAILKEEISKAKFILWNGPLGLYEDGYKGPTLELAKLIAEQTAKGATSIVGGGDTVAAIEKLNISDKFTFVSTGGGAMLDFLAKGNLPGIEALG